MKQSFNYRTCFLECLLEPSESDCWQNAGKKAKKQLKKRLPILQWLPNYQGCCNSYFFLLFFHSGMDASNPEIFNFLYTVIIPAAPQETVEEAGIEPGTAALHSGSPRRDLAN
jgi:hypothetical protein